MRNKTALTLLTAGAAAALVATTTPAFAAHEELSAAGLTSGGKKITTFELIDGTAEKAVKLDGLMGDSRLVGIDYRVFGGDDSLYGVGDRGGIYEVDPVSGEVDRVAALTVALEGTSFGVDFNPVANALRIISNTGQNLRQPFANIILDAPAAPTTVDGDLSIGATTANGVTGAAYTNNDANPATGTELYDIDTERDQLVLQAPPNSGTLVARGPLGASTSDVVGFDIYTEGTRNVSIAVLTVDGERGLYSINLMSGAATRIAGTNLTRGVSDIAITP